MRQFLRPSLGLLVACLPAIAVAEGIESGLQVGDKAGAFSVKDVTGPRKGKSLCYR